MVKENKSIKEIKDVKLYSDEPSWYHYVIVLIIFALLFVGIYYLLGLNKKETVPIIVNKNATPIKYYNYTYEEEGKKYNFKFNYPVAEIESYKIPIGIDKYSLLNSKDITFVFLDYNISDNKYVSISSVKLMRLIKYYFHFDFNKDNFQMISNYSCLNSTKANKVIIFNPYSNISGVFFNNSNGCINIDGINGTNLVKVNDKLMYSLVNS